MNHIYKTVWNEQTGTFVAVSENQKTKGKRSGSSVSRDKRASSAVRGVGALAAIAAAGALFMGSALALDIPGDDNVNEINFTTAGGSINFIGAGSITSLSGLAITGGLTADALTAASLSVAENTTIGGTGITTNNISVGNTVISSTGVAAGNSVQLGETGLIIAGGPSVTASGINANNSVIAGVADGTADTHAVNVSQLNEVRTAANAGWNLEAQGVTGTENIAPDETVTFAMGKNLEVARDGSTITYSTADDVTFTTVNATGSLTVGSAGNQTTINTGGITTSAVDAGDGTFVVGSNGITVGASTTVNMGGNKISGVADGAIDEDSTDAVTGGQVHELFFAEGADGIRYFHANSEADDSSAEGDESIAIGPNAVTTETSEGAIALGHGAIAGTEGSVVNDGEGSIAIGRDSQASGNSTLAVGDGASVDSEYVENATALGAGALVTGNSANGATAVGAHAHASDANATALGTNAQASGEGSIAVGQAHAAEGSALAAGDGAFAGTTRGIALGTNAGVGTVGNEAGDRTDHIAIGTNSGQDVEGNQSTAIGYGAGQGVVGDDNVALGTQAGGGLIGNNNISIGTGANNGARASAQAIAIGDGTQAGTNSVALGSGAQAEGQETLALGKDSSAGDNGVAVGAHATAEGSNVALGRNSAAYISDADGTGYLTGTAMPGSVVSVGNSNPGESIQRRIVNVADGSQQYDAVNVGQLHGAQEAVANLVGGNVIAADNGGFEGYVIELTDQGGDTHQYTTVAGAINAVSSGEISVLPGNAVIYNSNGTITVAEGVIGTDAVNVEQLNAAVAENGVKYVSANTTIDANRANDGATGTDAMAIGPAAVAGATSSLAIGHAASVDVGADNGVAIGHNVNAKAENTTVIGSNGAAAYDTGGVAIGQAAVSRGQNSIVMGTSAEADPKSGGTVDNAIVIGTVAEATADDGIAIGQGALASEERAVAQGYDAHAMATDSQAFGTRARTTGVNSQASGTDAHASGTSAIATGTNSRGYAVDGIAMGTGAVSGFVVSAPGDAARNRGSIAIGDTSRADDLNALALGVEAQARAESATAIGDGAVATADAEDGLAVGSSARVTAQNASAFGQGAEATALGALAAGSGAEAIRENATAIGQGASAQHAGSVALGAGSETAIAVRTQSAEIDGKTYDYAGATDGVTSTVSVGQVGTERTITNVAAGRVSDESTDAINGSQLYGTNMAVEALADDLDTAGQSVAAALGGTSSYNPETHTVTAGLAVHGTTYNNVQDALTYVGQGWDVSAEGGTAANVAPGGSVDFSNTDDNLEISRENTGLVFNLANDLTIGNSITVGDTVINGDRIVTNNLTVGGETRLGNNFVVNNAGDVHYNGSEIATQDDGLSFAGNTGGSISKTLGDDMPLTISGGLASSEASTGANLRVDSDGNQLNLVMARDLTDLDSITINNGGPVIGSDGIDMGSKQITNLAAGSQDDHAVNLGQLRDVEEVANRGWDVRANGEAAGANVAPGGSVDFSNTDGNILIERNDTDLMFDLAESIDLGEGGSLTTGNTVVNNDGVAVEDDAGNSTTVDAGTVEVVDAGGTTTIAGNVVSVGGDNPIVISGDVGTISGLTNTTFDPDSFTSGQAATEDQLGQVYDVANAGWHLTDADDNEVNIGPNGLVTFEGDQNIAVEQTGVDQDGAIEITLNRDLDVDSVVAGDTVLDTDGLAVTDDDGNVTAVAAGGTTVTDDAGNSTTVGAGTVEVVDAGGTTTIAGNVISVGGDNPIVISGDAGTIGGLTNQTIDYPEFADGTGRAATEEQLDVLNQTANAGWNLTDADDNAVNIGPNGLVTFEGDDNISVSQTGEDQDGVIEVALNRDLDVDSLTAGDAVLDTDGLTIDDGAGNMTTVAVDGTTVTDGTATTTVGAGVVTVAGGINTIVIDGDAGTIGGLTNLDFDPDNIVSGQAATEDQLGQVSDVANAGWNISANGDDASSNVAPGSLVDFSNTDDNITLALEDIMGEDDDGNPIVIGQEMGVNLASTLAIGGDDTTDGVLIGDKGAVDGDGHIIPGITVPGGTNGDQNVVIGGGDITLHGFQDVNGSPMQVGETLMAGMNFSGNNFSDTDGSTVINKRFGEQLEILGVDWIETEVGADGKMYIKLADGFPVVPKPEQPIDPGVPGEPGEPGTPPTDPVKPGEGLGNIVAGGDIEGGKNIVVTGPDPDNPDDFTIVVETTPEVEHDKVTVGDVVINQDGIDAGGTQITDVAAGTENNHAVNLGQLKDLDNDLTQKGLNFADSEGNVVHRDLGQTLQVVGSNENISTKASGNGILEIALNNDLKLDSVTINNGGPVIDGNGIDMSDNRITNVADGVDAGDAVNLGQLEGGLQDLDDELTQKGLNFADSAGNIAHRDLGETLHIVGANENITTNVTQGSILEIALSDDLQVDSVTINNGGPIINQHGIDMSDNRITNVADGVGPRDAVNVGQLETVRDNLQGQVNDLRGDLRRQDKKLSAGVAAAMATAALPQAYLPGKTMMGMAAGTWNGESGMAIGFSGITDSGKWIYKLSGNSTSRGDYGGAIGVGYQW